MLMMFTQGEGSMIGRLDLPQDGKKPAPSSSMRGMIKRILNVEDLI